MSSSHSRVNLKVGLVGIIDILLECPSAQLLLLKSLRQIKHSIKYISFNEVSDSFHANHPAWREYFLGKYKHLRITLLHIVFDSRQVTLHHIGENLKKIGFVIVFLELKRLPGTTPPGRTQSQLRTVHFGSPNAVKDIATLSPALVHNHLLALQGVYFTAVLTSPWRLSVTYEDGLISESQIEAALLEIIDSHTLEYINLTKEGAIIPHNDANTSTWWKPGIFKTLYRPNPLLHSCLGLIFIFLSLELNTQESEKSVPVTSKILTAIALSHSLLVFWTFQTRFSSVLVKTFIGGEMIMPSIHVYAICGVCLLFSSCLSFLVVIMANHITNETFRTPVHLNHTTVNCALATIIFQMPTFIGVRYSNLRFYNDYLQKLITFLEYKIIDTCSRDGPDNTNDTIAASNDVQPITVGQYIPEGANIIEIHPKDPARVIFEGDTVETQLTEKIQLPKRAFVLSGAVLVGCQKGFGSPRKIPEYNISFIDLGRLLDREVFFAARFQGLLSLLLGGLYLIIGVAISFGKHKTHLETFTVTELPKIMRSAVLIPLSVTPILFYSVMNLALHFAQRMIYKHLGIFCPSSEAILMLASAKHIVFHVSDEIVRLLPASFSVQQTDSINDLWADLRPILEQWIAIDNGTGLHYTLPSHTIDFTGGSSSGMRVMIIIVGLLIRLGRGKPSLCDSNPISGEYPEDDRLVNSIILDDRLEAVFTSKDIRVIHYHRETDSIPSSSTVFVNTDAAAAINWNWWVPKQVDDEVQALNDSCLTVWLLHRQGSQPLLSNIMKSSYIRSFFSVNEELAFIDTLRSGECIISPLKYSESRLGERHHISAEPGGVVIYYMGDVPAERGNELLRVVDSPIIRSNEIEICAKSRGIDFVMGKDKRSDKMKLLYEYALFEKKMTTIAVWFYYINLLGTCIWNFAFINRNTSVGQHPSRMESFNFLLLVASPLSCFVSSAVLLRYKLGRRWSKTMISPAIESSGSGSFLSPGSISTASTSTHLPLDLDNNIHLPQKMEHRLDINQCLPLDPAITSLDCDV